MGPISTISGWEKQSQKSENSSSVDIEVVEGAAQEEPGEEDMAASETEIDLNDMGEPLEVGENEEIGSPEIPEEIPEEIVVDENGQDSPDLGPSRQLHTQRIPSRGQIAVKAADESSDNAENSAAE